MVTDLGQSVHGQPAHLLPLFFAFVNGMAPLAISLVILLPLWLAPSLDPFSTLPLESAFAMALIMIFLLGVYLGQVSHTFWLWAGLRNLINCRSDHRLDLYSQLGMTASQSISAREPQVKKASD